MAYCPVCGHRVNAKARFCENCGQKLAAFFNSDSMPEQRQQQFDGVLHKCPNCGEVLSSFELACPACGYELRDSKASKSFRELAEKSGIRQSNISRIENGTCSPTAATLQALAKGMGKKLCIHFL